MEETYEDGMVLSRTAANRFKYISNISMYLDASRDDFPTIHSTILPHSVPWWQNHFDGVVSSIEGIGNGKVKLVVVSHCLPVNGDNFTALHGQKGVVTILDDYRMPSINGKTADIVIASSSIIKRQTTSQLLEAASNMHCVTHMEVKSCVSYDDVQNHYNNGYRITHPNVVNILSTYEGIVEIGGERVTRIISTTRNNEAISCPVRANYGIIRVMQSSFLASFRTSCTHKLARCTRVRPESSSSRGGSSSLGEMEVTQLMASGIISVLDEFNITNTGIGIGEMPILVLTFFFQQCQYQCSHTYCPYW